LEVVEVVAAVQIMEVTPLAELVVVEEDIFFLELLLALLLLS
jgi:hypothetical protein